MSREEQLAGLVEKWRKETTNNPSWLCADELEAILSQPEQTAAPLEPYFLPSGAFTKEVREKVLAPSPCGVEGHFAFQLNGGSCLMCQREYRIEKRAREAAAPAAPLDATLVPNSALRWLFGEEGDFEPPARSYGKFWWRSEFRKRIGELPAAPAAPLDVSTLGIPVSADPRTVNIFERDEMTTKHHTNIPPAAPAAGVTAEQEKTDD